MSFLSKKAKRKEVSEWMDEQTDRWLSRYIGICWYENYKFVQCKLSVWTLFIYLFDESLHNLGIKYLLRRES